MRFFSRSRRRGIPFKAALMLAFFLSSVAGGHVHAQIPAGTPPIRLSKVPAIALSQDRPLDAKETARIKGLIKQLARTDFPKSAYPSPRGGMPFAPIPDPESLQVIVLPRREQKSSNPFTELVRLGPRALPFLLDALTDKTPTKFITKIPSQFSMGFSNEMGSNPANARERIITNLPDKGLFGTSSNLSSYIMTIGDLCFVVIGQIVGREYNAIRYQPSGMYIVNSPTHDPNIARAVRALWAGKNPSQVLLNSLLLDYSTRGIHRGGKNVGFDDWDAGSSPQIPAAMRLLFYFPRQTAPIIAQRLNRLQVQRVDRGADYPASEQEMALWEKRELANEVRTVDFLKAVSWCREPEMDAALRSLRRRAGDPDILQDPYLTFGRKQH